jgi:2-haloacid dehalogenase
LKTASVARPTEYGPLQSRDFKADGDWEIVAGDFNGIADRLASEAGGGRTLWRA